jgi:hypothetical protein
MKIRITLKSCDLYRVVWRKGGHPSYRHFYKRSDISMRYKTLTQIRQILGWPTDDAWDPFVEILKAANGSRTYKFLTVNRGLDTLLI